jgi:diacylglycerol kinase (ATP)
LAPALVIINPVSGPARGGSASERRNLAVSTLETLGIPADVQLTGRPGHAYDLARAAVESGAKLVVAWGGDGTINEVGRAVAFTSTSLGLVPGGSGNGFARELGVPFSPRAALERALQTPARQIDAGEIDGRLFFNVAGIGLDARVAARVARRHRAQGGLGPYIVAGTQEMLSRKPIEYSIETDKGRFCQTALIVALGNSRQYGYGAKVAPVATVDDGELDLVVIDDCGLIGNLTRLPFLFTGGLHRQRGVTTLRVRELTIQASSPMVFHVDGEPFAGGNRLSARVRPGAVSVRA